MSAEPLAKTYDPAATEARWQAAWEEAGAFHPDPAAGGEPFAVVAAMEAEGFLVKVEPLLSTQWLARAEPLAAADRALWR